VEARKILVEGGRVAAVVADQERISCRWVVMPRGLCRPGGRFGRDRIPVKPRVARSSARPPMIGFPGMIPLVIDLERDGIFRREREGFLLAGPQDEEPSLNIALDSGRSSAWSSENALHRIPALEEMEINGVGRPLRDLPGSACDPGGGAD